MADRNLEMVIAGEHPFAIGDYVGYDPALNSFVKVDNSVPGRFTPLGFVSSLNPVTITKAGTLLVPAGMVNGSYYYDVTKSRLVTTPPDGLVVTVAIVHDSFMSVHDASKPYAVMPQIMTGTAPVSTEGRNGDLFFGEAGKVWKKVAGVWLPVADVKGDKGDAPKPTWQGTKLSWDGVQFVDLKGSKGDIPAHQWHPEGKPAIRFQNPDGSFPPQFTWVGGTDGGGSGGGGEDVDYSLFVLRGGDTMTGPLIVQGHNVTALNFIQQGAGLTTTTYYTKAEIDALLPTAGGGGQMTPQEILDALLTVDGEGKGLDADLLDGLHASAFALADHVHDYTDIDGLEAILNGLQGQIDGKVSKSGDTMTGALVVQGHTVTASNFLQVGSPAPTTTEYYTKTDIDRLFEDFVPTSPETGESILEKLLLVDGHDSGLDADTVDGFHASAFALADHVHDYTEIEGLEDILGGLQTQIDGKVSKAGDTMTGALVVQGHTVTASNFLQVGHPDPGTTTDYYTKIEIDALLPTAGGGGQMTPQEILDALLTVDGEGKGLDADMLDGLHASAFALADHTHNYEEILGLEAVLLTMQEDIDSKAPLDHRHDYTEIEGLVGELNKRVLKAGDTMTGALVVQGHTVTASNFLQVGHPDPGTTTDYYTKIEIDALLPTAGGGGQMTPKDILDALLLVDGEGSLLDADTLDNLHASAFALAGHTHNYEEILGLEAVLLGMQEDIDGKASIDHTHQYTEILGLVPVLTSMQEDIDSKAPLDHKHDYTEIEGLVGELNKKVAKAGDTMTGALVVQGHTVTASNFLQVGHPDPGTTTDYYTKIEIDALLPTAGGGGQMTPQDILDALLTVDGEGKGLDADLLDGLHASAFALASHTHLAKDITDLQGLLDGKAPLSHTHLAKDITDLQGLLDGKAPLVHTHTKDQVGLGNVDNTADIVKNVDSAIRLRPEVATIDANTLYAKQGLYHGHTWTQTTNYPEATSGMHFGIQRNDAASASQMLMQFWSKGGNTLMFRTGSGWQLNNVVYQSWVDIWHAGNSNLSTVDWNVRALNISNAINSNSISTGSKQVIYASTDTVFLGNPTLDRLQLELGDANRLFIKANNQVAVVWSGFNSNRDDANWIAKILRAVSKVTTPIFELHGTSYTDLKASISFGPKTGGSAGSPGDLGVVLKFLANADPLSRSLYVEDGYVHALNFIQRGASVTTTGFYTKTEIDNLLSNLGGGGGTGSPAEILAALITVDGAGSMLDADTLDGLHASAFATAQHQHGVGDIVNLQNLLDGKAPLVHTHEIADVTGLQGALDSKLNASAYTAADILAKLKTVDGSGSGLDADLLDGVSGAGYWMSYRGGIDGTDLDIFTVRNSGSYRVMLIGSSGLLNVLTLGSGASASSLELYNHYNAVDFRFRVSVDNNRYSSWRTIWHSGNSNLPTVDWAVNNLYSSSIVEARVIRSVQEFPQMQFTNAGITSALYRASTGDFDLHWQKDMNVDIHAKLWHSRNSNLTTVDWKAKSLILAGSITGATTIDASGNVTALNFIQQGAGLTTTTYYTKAEVDALIGTGGGGGPGTPEEILAALLTVDGSGSLLDSDTLDGLHADAFALASHTHIIGDITGLQSALDGKASLVHTHAIADVTGLQGLLDGKAPVSHTHTIAQVTGLQTALDGKSPLVHTHTKDQVGLGNVDNTADSSKNVYSAQYLRDSSSFVTDLNDNSSGIAHFLSTTITSDKPNTPSDSAAGSMIQVVRAPGGITGSTLIAQIYASTSATRLDDWYFRKGAGNGTALVWGEWRKMYHDGNANKTTVTWNADRLNANSIHVNDGYIFRVRSLEFIRQDGLQPDLVLGSNFTNLGFRFNAVVKQFVEESGVSATSNANSVLTQRSHSGEYYHQLLFNSDTNLYHRYFGATNNNLTAWKKIWDSGNSNLPTVDWAVRSLNAASFVNGLVLVTNEPTNPQIQFRKSSTDIRLLFRSNNDLKWRYEYEHGTSNYKDGIVWHSGNSNLTTVDWKAKDLILAGSITGATTIDASGNVTALNFIQQGAGLTTTTYYTKAEVDALLGTGGGGGPGTPEEILAALLTVDGAGSLLDSDTVDGLHADAFALASHTHIIGDITGLQSALDSKLNASAYTAADILAKLKTVDGAGSGLDADMLDGIDSTRIIYGSDGSGTFNLWDSADDRVLKSGFYRTNGKGDFGSLTQLAIHVSHMAGYTNRQHSAGIAFNYTGGEAYIYGYDSSGIFTGQKRIWHTNNSNNTGADWVARNLTLAGSITGATTVTANSFVGALTGNATTATTLASSRTLWGQAFNGSANVSGALTGVTDITGTGTFKANRFDGQFEVGHYNSNIGWIIETKMNDLASSMIRGTIKIHTYVSSAIPDVYEFQVYNYQSGNRWANSRLLKTEASNRDRQFKLFVNAANKVCIWVGSIGNYESIVATAYTVNRSPATENIITSITGSALPSDAVDPIDFAIINRIWHSENANLATVDWTVKYLFAGAVRITDATYPQIQFDRSPTDRRLFFRNGDKLMWRHDGTNDGEIWHSLNSNTNTVDWMARKLVASDALSLYGSSFSVDAAGLFAYGIAFKPTSGRGGHGFVNGDWATYFTIANAANRGWIFRRDSTNVASISANGDAYMARLTVDRALLVTDTGGAGVPFTIQRNTSPSEQAEHYMQDDGYVIKVTNDEANARINFNITATDTETGGGANPTSNAFAFFEAYNKEMFLNIRGTGAAGNGAAPIWRGIQFRNYAGLIAGDISHGERSSSTHAGVFRLRTVTNDANKTPYEVWTIDVNGKTTYYRDIEMQLANIKLVGGQGKFIELKRDFTDTVYEKVLATRYQWYNDYWDVGVYRTGAQPIGRLTFQLFQNTALKEQMFLDVTGDLTVSRFVTAVNFIQAGAGMTTTGFYTKAEVDALLGTAGGGGGSDSAEIILSKLITVDGSGSMLDADLLDGLHASAFATAQHQHGVGDIVNLQNLLDGKAPTSHTHTIGQVTNLQTSLDQKLDAKALSWESNGQSRLVFNANTTLGAGWARRFTFQGGGSHSKYVNFGAYGGTDGTTEYAYISVVDKGDTSDWSTAKGLTVSATDVRWKNNPLVDTSVYTAADVLAKLKTVHGAGSGLDADMIDGFHIDSLPVYIKTNIKDGANSVITTEKFIEVLTSMGYIATNRYFIIRTTWSYADNSKVDTPLGIIDLAGSVVQVFHTSNSISNPQYIIKVTTPTTAASSSYLRGEFVYVNHGAGYSPGWRRIWDSNVSNNTTSDWVARNLTLAGSITGATTITASGTVTAPTFSGAFSGALTGNASTATALQTTRTLWGRSFNGTQNISGDIYVGGQVQDVTTIRSSTWNGEGINTQMMNATSGGVLYVGNPALTRLTLEVQDYDSAFVKGAAGRIWNAGNFDPNSKLNVSAYTAADVLAKLLTVDGAGSGLDADLLDGRDSTGFLKAKMGAPANLNDLREEGTYHWTTGTLGRPDDNSPYGSILQIDGYGTSSGGWNHQLGFDTNAGLWHRQAINGITNWTAWDKIWTSRNANLATIDWTVKRLWVNDDITIRNSGTPNINFSTAVGNDRLLRRSGDNLLWRYNGTDDATIWHRGNLANQDGGRDSIDVNTRLLTGFYGIAGSTPNSPGAYTSLIVARGIDTGLQIAGGYSTDQLWFRGWSGYGATFTEWRKLWHAGNVGAGSGLDADLLDGQHGTYYDHRRYNDSGSYLGGYYTSGGTERPNNAVFERGKLKLAMLGGANLGLPTTWHDVLWMSSYNGGDVKASHALVFVKTGVEEMYFSRQNWDASEWGTMRRVWHSGNSNSTTTDWAARNLTVAGALYANEFVVNQTRATNGNLVVTDGAIIAEKYTDANNIIRLKFKETLVPFVVGDFLVIQQYNPGSQAVIKSMTFRVSVIDATGTQLNVVWGAANNAEAFGKIEIGDSIVRLGNESNAERQNSIWLHASGTGTPRIDLVSGVTNDITTDKIVTRLGKMDGLTWNNQAVTGIGLWSKKAYLENAYLSGEIQSTSGQIGGWSIGSNSLTSQGSKIIMRSDLGRIMVNSATSGGNMSIEPDMAFMMGDGTGNSDRLLWLRHVTKKVGVKQYALYQNNAISATYSDDNYHNFYGAWFQEKIRVGGLELSTTNWENTSPVFSGEAMVYVASPNTNQAFNLPSNPPEGTIRIFMRHGKNLTLYGNGHRIYSKGGQADQITLGAGYEPCILIFARGAWWAMFSA